jgi:hypothetical protein
MARDKSFGEFIRIRRARLDADKFTGTFTKELHTICTYICSEIKSVRADKMDYPGLTLRRPYTEDWLVHALAVYVAEITLCTEGWEYITTEWAAHDVMFSNSMNNFDALVDMLTDNPMFPILQAQQSHLITCGRIYPDLSDTCKQLHSMVRAPDVALWTLGDFHPEALCGVPIEAPVRVNAFNYMPSTDRLCVVAENPLLLLLSHAAGILTTIFQVTENQTFAASREMSTNNATRSLSANVDRVLHECGPGEGVVRCMAVDAYSRIIETPYTPLDTYVHDTMERIRIAREANTS